jgi:hypothetical protein
MEKHTKHTGDHIKETLRDEIEELGKVLREELGRKSRTGGTTPNRNVKNKSTIEAESPNISPLPSLGKPTEPSLDKKKYGSHLKVTDETCNIGKEYKGGPASYNSDDVSENVKAEIMEKLAVMRVEYMKRITELEKNGQYTE